MKASLFVFFLHEGQRSWSVTEQFIDTLQWVWAVGTGGGTRRLNPQRVYTAVHLSVRSCLSALTLWEKASPVSGLWDAPPPGWRFVDNSILSHLSTLPHHVLVMPLNLYGTLMLQPWYELPATQYFPGSCAMETLLRHALSHRDYSMNLVAWTCYKFDHVWC